MSKSKKQNYPISTPDLVSIGVKELAKDIPIIGSIISSSEMVFSKIEENRVKKILIEIENRLEFLEKDQKKIQEIVNKPSACATLIYGCEQARSDVLLESKAKDYGCAIGNLMYLDAEMDDVVEILDSLRKLSGHDLKTLYQFKISGQILDSRAIAELVGYKDQINPIIDDTEIIKIKDNMKSLYPTIMRLQSLGVLFLQKNEHGGMILPIGGLAEHLNSFAILTPMGLKLVQALP